MASTTTNLGLTKPAYSDDADISDINGNMDLIDAEAGRVRANVAANYDSSETYAVGDYCLHDGSLYKCSTAISSPEAWTAGHWTQIKITGELSALNGNIAHMANSRLLTVTANSSTTFTVPQRNMLIAYSFCNDVENYGYGRIAIGGASRMKVVENVRVAGTEFGCPMISFSLSNWVLTVTNSKAWGCALAIIY